MNKVKSITLFAAMLLICVSGIAQPGGQRQRPSAEDRAARQTSRMVGELDLDAEQAEAVEAVNLRFAQAQDSIFSENMGDRQAMRAAMQPLMEERKAAMEAILSEEQMAKLEEMAEQQRQQGGRPGGRGGRGGRGQGGNPDQN